MRIAPANSDLEFKMSQIGKDIHAADSLINLVEIGPLIGVDAIFQFHILSNLLSSEVL